MSGNAILTIGKFIVWGLTRSPSMLAESIHSLGDTANQLLLYLGFKKGQIGPCHRYPMGQGRASYVFNLFAAIGIGLGALYTFNHSYHELNSIHQGAIALSWPSIAILAFAGILEFIIFWIAFKAVWKNKGDSSLLTYLKEADDPSILAILFEDGIAVLGALIALVGIIVSYKIQSPLPDIITSFIIATLLMVMAIFLGKMNYHLIVGTQLPTAERNKISDFIAARPEVEKIIHIQTETLAPGKVRLSLEIEFHGERIGSNEELRHDLKVIERGGHLAATLIESRDRAIRNLGKSIDQLEKEIYREFPDIVLVDLEPN
ncbi:MAG: cation diffusion facilitator family transporter [Halobacteriovoraceae bacterium]|nr:cation diffusion facilitator family transporter [Halobacteriovoraceae bacterium]